MEGLELLTVKDLQAKLGEMGMPKEDAERFSTKAQLIATIRALEAKDAVANVTVSPEEVKKVASIEETPNPSEDREVNKRWKTKAEAMKEHLLSQEFVSILIPLDAGQQAGLVVWQKEKGGRLTDAEWEKLSLAEKMRTFQVHVSGNIESVQLNGYKYFMPKGRYVRVPRQIAEVVSNSQQQTLEAGSDINLDRIDPNTGKPFSEVL